jgi:hypothetical protein
MVLVDGEQVTWQHQAGDYDLSRRVWSTTWRLAIGDDPRTGGWTHTGVGAGTAEATYSRSDEPDGRGRRWHRFEHGPIARTTSVVDDIGDTSQLLSLQTAKGTAVAYLEIGSNRRVRELRVAGVDIHETSTLPGNTVETLPRQSSRTTLTAFGKPVTVRVPGSDEISSEPAPTLAGRP